MSAVLHLPVINTQNPYMLKDKAVESFAPAFTPVNRRGSPPSPRASTSTIAMSARETPIHYPKQTSPEEEYHSLSPLSSTQLSSGESSPDGPKKRKRSEPAEDPGAVRGMEPPQHRALPPIDRFVEHERRWTAEPQTQNGYQEVRDARPVESINGSMPPMAVSLTPRDEMNEHEPGSSTDATRAGVQQQHIDAKRRKRQFANRTKTGCGTCRRRKKKCDEAKPDCNNCTRGGFVCEGYASKIPWPKNGVTKPPPPLQAKEQMTHDPTSAYPRCPGCNTVHIPHCEPTRSNSLTYSDPRTISASEGARIRPIVVEEQERKPPAPSSWTNGWNESPRTSYAEQATPVPAQYSQPPAPNPDRTPSHDHYLPQPHGVPPPSRQHTARVYHHTPQSMSHTASHTPALTDAHHQTPQQPRQSPLAPPTSAPPAPPQTHYAPPPRAHKSEKEKMLNGDPFLPHDEQLMDERAQCTGAVYRFNSIANPSVIIAGGDRERHFKRIVAAAWILPRHMDPRPGAPQGGGHLGGNVNVNTPFHCDYGYNISIGDNVIIGPNCQLLDSARIAIGRNTKIGARVTISTLKTPTDVKSLKGSKGTELARDVHIGENVYIGDSVIIEAGVRIGNNAIIRAGSVVVRDIASNVVAHGNPAFG